MARRKAFETSLLDAVREVRRPDLDEAAQLDLDLLVNGLALTVEGFQYPEELIPLNQMGGVQQDVADILGLMQTRNAQDYEHILQRLAGTPALIQQTLHWMRRGLERGITPPAITLRNVPAQVQNLLSDDPFASGLLRPFAERPAGIDARAWEVLRRRAADLYTAQLVPAYRELHDYLVEVYIPGARENVGLGSVPGGQDWYRYLARVSTTTDLTPDEIHDIGQREVKRIRAEMEKIIKETGFSGSFEDFTHFLRTDPQFYHSSAEELLREYRDIAKRADAELPKLFGVLPRNPYGVVAVPEYSAASQTTAYYQPGSLKGGRAGFFFANTYALDTRPRWEMEALTLHEAVPGHHLQLALAQELEGIHALRRYTHYTAFVEGWGLYAESLGGEMGFYADPYSKFGQLTYEMWRAVRLVVDTGMHAMGWARQQAMDFFRSNSAKTEHDITVEIDRYIVWPGQALAYKIGELKIKELRALAQKELGDKFDVRWFHDRVLAGGAIPLNVLEARIREAVAARRAAGG